MKNFSTWLLVIFMIAFWAFRVAVAVASEFGMEFMGTTVLSSGLEVMLCFVVLACIILVVKRKLIGALIYLLVYGMYFGVDFYQRLTFAINSPEVGITDITSAIISFLGIILPIMVLLDMLVDRGRKLHPTDKKTDWFYKNEQYDRNVDERADKNNYRNY